MQSAGWPRIELGPVGKSHRQSETYAASLCPIGKRILWLPQKCFLPGLRIPFSHEFAADKLNEHFIRSLRCSAHSLSECLLKSEVSEFAFPQFVEGAFCSVKSKYKRSFGGETNASCLTSQSGASRRPSAAGRPLTWSPALGREQSSSNPRLAQP